MEVVGLTCSKEFEQLLKNGLGKDNSQQRQLLKVAKVNKVSQIKGWFPTSKVFNKGKNMDHVVHPNVRNFASVQILEREFVHIETRHYAKGSQKTI